MVSSRREAKEIQKTKKKNKKHLKKKEKHTGDEGAGKHTRIREEVSCVGNTLADWVLTVRNTRCR